MLVPDVLRTMTLYLNAFDALQYAQTNKEACSIAQWRLKKVTPLQVYQMRRAFRTMLRHRRKRKRVNSWSGRRIYHPSERFIL